MHPPTVKTLVAALAVVGLWIIVPAFGDVPDANSISCPNAPSGWTLPANGRYVLSPNPLEATDGGGDRPIDNEVEVNCTYFNGAGEPVVVNTSYALPTDINPWSDFDFGCTSVNYVPGYLPITGFPWDTQHRVYFTLSSKSWSYAEFEDPYSVLANKDVGSFESITNDLLASAQPAAHNCQLAGGGNPTPVLFPWYFSFKFTGTNNNVSLSGGSRGSFVTAPSKTSPTGIISHLQASDIFVTATPKGASAQKLTIRVGDPLLFRAFYTETLKAEISVVSSNYAACPKGSTGTLVVSSDPAPAVELDICGDLLPAGANEQAATSISTF